MESATAALNFRTMPALLRGEIVRQFEKLRKIKKP
jgi:hypothetical protein